MCLLQKLPRVLHIAIVQFLISQNLIDVATSCKSLLLACEDRLGCSLSTFCRLLRGLLLDNLSLRALFSFLTRGKQEPVASFRDISFEKFLKDFTAVDKSMYLGIRSRCNVISEHQERAEILFWFLADQPVFERRMYGLSYLDIFLKHFLDSYAGSDSLEYLPSVAIEKLEKGDYCEAYDPVCEAWFVSRVRFVKDDRVFVHFLGFDNCWDTWLSRTQDCLRPCQTSKVILNLQLAERFPMRHTLARNENI
jgi:hypothetical protein